MFIFPPHQPRHPDARVLPYTSLPTYALPSPAFAALPALQRAQPGAVATLFRQCRFTDEEALSTALPAFDLCRRNPGGGGRGGGGEGDGGRPHLLLALII